MAAHSNLLDLKANTLLNKFGRGGHVPGSGSAAALMGLLSAQLLVTVATLTLGKPKYEAHHIAIGQALRDTQDRIYPELCDLFQADADVFDAVIATRKARNRAQGTAAYEALAEAATEQLKLATDIPFRIAEACLDLVAHSILIFDSGFEAARGDSGAALSSAFAGANSAVFIVNLNLKSFEGTYWARQQRARCDEVRERLKAAQADAGKRVGVLRIADLEQAKRHELTGKFQLTVRESYSDEQILEACRRLQNILWRNREKLWPSAPNHPLATFDPETALRVLGYACQVDETLGTFSSSDGLFEVAGLFDANLGRVRLSRQFSRNEQLFTAAHELGHAVLHPQMDGAHRDRPKSGVAVSREPREKEADRFATFFLMPPNLAKERFESNFGSAPLVLGDDTAFHMGFSGLQAARAKFRTLRELSRHVAGLERYAGRQVVPLSEQFHVSLEALAIRLEELELVALR
jgi:formiminotetrahydrofolate cyclodeaminase